MLYYLDMTMAKNFTMMASLAGFHTVVLNVSHFLFWPMSSSSSSNDNYFCGYKDFLDFLMNWSLFSVHTDFTSFFVIFFFLTMKAIILFNLLLNFILVACSVYFFYNLSYYNLKYHYLYNRAKTVADKELLKKEYSTYRT